MAATTIAEGTTYAADDLTLTVAANHGLTAQEFIKCESEIMLITAVSGNDLTVLRARAGTTAAAHADTTAVTQVNVAYASATSLSAAITDVAATTISVARTADIAVYDYIKIGNEVLFVTDIDTTNNVLTVVRGVLNT